MIIIMIRKLQFRIMQNYYWRKNLIAPYMLEACSFNVDYFALTIDPPRSIAQNTFKLGILINFKALQCTAI